MITARDRLIARLASSGIILIRAGIGSGNNRGISATVVRIMATITITTARPPRIITGRVIGGVVGHEIGYGDPGHTAAGAVIGTVIGYEIARHR